MKRKYIQFARKTHLLLFDAKLGNIIRKVFTVVFHYVTEQPENKLRMYSGLNMTN